MESICVGPAQGQRSPTMVHDTSSWCDLPTCIISSLSHKTKQLQAGHKPVIKKAIIWPWGQSSKSNVTKHGTPHIIVRWSTHMPNINSISRKTNKLQPGHELIIEKAIIWPWDQRSQVTNHGTRHIVLRWSTRMSNIKSLSHKTKKLQPGHEVVIKKNNNLTMRSKFKVKGHQRCYATHRLDVIYPHA